MTFKRNKMNQNSLLRAGQRIHRDYAVPDNVKSLPGIAMPKPVANDDYDKRAFDLQKRHSPGKMDQHFDITGLFQMLYSGAQRIVLGEEQEIWSYRVPQGESFIIQTYQFIAKAPSQPLLSQSLYGPIDLWRVIRFYIRVNGASPIHTRSVYSYENAGGDQLEEQEGFSLLTQTPELMPKSAGPAILAPPSSKLSVSVLNVAYTHATTTTPIDELGFRLRGFSTPLKMED